MGGQATPSRREAAGLRAVLALGGPSSPGDAPSRARPVLGAWGSSAHTRGSDRLPQAGGQGILGSGSEGPGGQALKHPSPPWGPPLPEPRCPRLASHSFRGHPPLPVLRPPGAASMPPAGPLLGLGWEPPPLVPPVPHLTAPVARVLCQLQAPAVHPDGAGPGPPAPAHTETT